MTSATGSSENGDRRPEGRVIQRFRASQGFTMVELLVTISLIVFLMGMLAVGAGRYLESASKARTMALIQRLSLIIEKYHSITGDYPSDGLDGIDVITTDGTFLFGGAALTHALTQPLVLTQKQPNGEIRVIGEEPAIGDFRSDELSSPSDGDQDARQLLDAWAEPIHYDNVSGGEVSFSGQGLGDTHLDWDDDEQVHSEDPREVGEGTDGIGPQNTNGFDIWSHGSSGHSEEESYDDLNTNWQGGQQ